MATFIAGEPEFQWFSTRERTGMEVAADRSSLARYLEERRQRQVKQHLDEFQFNGVDGEHANFGFVITEGAGEANVTYPGKGAIHCSSGRIIVWSEGAPS